MNITDVQVTILVEFYLEPDMIEAFEAVLIPHLKRVASESTCLMIFADKDPDNTTRYLLYEQWADKNKFLSIQMNRAYRIPYNTAIEPMEASPRRVTLWQSTLSIIKA